MRQWPNLVDALGLGSSGQPWGFESLLAHHLYLGGKMTKKLMELESYSNGDSYWRVACDCTEPDHDAKLWFEKDDDFGHIILNLSMEVGIYPRYNFLENLWQRITVAAKVFFTGYHTATGDVILDEDGIKAMQEALKKGLAHAKASKR